MSGAVTLRETVSPADRGAVRRIVSSSGFFNPQEVEVAVELVDDRLSRGEASGYHFVFADRDGETVGYSCYGHIEGTAESHDFYWIAVDGAKRVGGVGGVLLAATEAAVFRLGGRRLYVETSSRPLYEPTRAFYRKHGYIEETRLRDFYAPGDDKVFFVKVLKG